MGVTREGASEGACLFSLYLMDLSWQVFNLQVRRGMPSLAE